MRPRLLFLVDALDQDYQSEITRGVVREARRHGADLVILVGGQMMVTSRYLKYRRFVYDLANPRDFDGVIFLGTSLSSLEGREALTPLIMRFATLPTVSLGLDIGKGGSVLVDNAEGMTKITEHLIKIHGCKKMAYISGPAANKEASIRLQTFRDVLAGENLTIPEEWLVFGDFTKRSGAAAVTELLDEREVDVQSLDAIVAANDSMAIGVMEELKRRAIRVPREVAVVGFDDIEAARYTSPPLTTAQQPLAMQGERAIQRVLSPIGGPATGKISVKPKLVIRRSCGCGRGLEAPNIRYSDPPDPLEDVGRVVARKRTNIENDLARVAENGGITSGWEEPLLDAVIAELSGEGSGKVPAVIEARVRESVEAGEGLHTWTAVIATLDKHLNGLVHIGTDASAQIETVMHRARVAMSEAAEQVHASRNRELLNRTTSFNEIAAALLTAMDTASFADAVIEHLPGFGIDTCSVSLFESHDTVGTSLKRFLVMDSRRRLASEGTFRSSLIAPPEIVDDRPHHLVIEPLCFDDDVFGVAAFEYGPTDGNVYEQLGALFSASLRAIYSTEKNVNARRRLEASALVDELTGVYNQRHLAVRFREEVIRAGQIQRPLSFVLMDMDGFRVLNDELGEAEGDRALKGVADTLKKCTAPTQIVARIKADEFALLLPNTDADAAMALAKRLGRQLKLALAMAFQGHISASFGVETSTEPHETSEAALTEATTRALENAKATGKDRAVHARELVD